MILTRKRPCCKTRSPEDWNYETATVAKSTLTHRRETQKLVIFNHRDIDTEFLLAYFFELNGATKARRINGEK